MSRHLLRALVACIALWAACSAAAQIAVPALRAHVQDLTGTLSAAEISSLEATLTRFEATSGMQLAILLLPTTAPESIEQYALRVAEQWQLGRKKIDDGAVIVVAKADRAVRIEVGYGLEGTLTDITSMRIIRETMLPLFAAGDYAAGLQAGVARVIEVSQGAQLPAPPSRKPQNGGIGQFAPLLFIFAMVGGGVLRSIFGKLPGAVLTGGGVALLTWFLLGGIFIAILAGLAALLLTLFGGITTGRGGGGFYPGGGGLGGGGGFSGGGFSGGGGSFGGGGASGRW